MKKRIAYFTLIGCTLAYFSPTTAYSLNEKEGIIENGSSKNQDQIYLDYLREKLNFEADLFPCFSEKNITQPSKILEFFDQKMDTLNFPPGDYRTLNMHTWVEEYNNSIKSKEGWILYVTATPDSALKIAKLILEIVNPRVKEKKNIDPNFKAENNKHVQFEIISNLPNMRTLWYVLPHVQKEKTKEGEFITIFPDDEQHALKLASSIDQILLQEIKKGNLSKEDFHFVNGGAQLGKSGGLYTRHGPFLDRVWTSIEKSDNHQHLPVTYGNRDFPWPDYFNRINMTNPFGSLDLTWQHPSMKEFITWEKRPKTWKALKGISPKIVESTFYPSKL